MQATALPPRFVTAIAPNSAHKTVIHGTEKSLRFVKFEGIKKLFSVTISNGTASDYYILLFDINYATEFADPLPFMFLTAEAGKTVSFEMTTGIPISKDFCLCLSTDNYNWAAVDDSGGIEIHAVITYA